MEIRVLQYFLAVAREQNISNAAEILHITQPTLSRQLKDLEDELGKQLFIRGNRKITLTEDGMLFRKRAEEIVELVRKTKNEITNTNDIIISGDIYIGAGETNAINIIANVFNNLNKKYPNIHYHIFSDDGLDVIENLDKGLIDFGILLGEFDKTKYNYITFPVKDIWGILMRNDSSLAKLNSISPKDLIDKPLIISRQVNNNANILKWFATDIEKLNVVATYNLVYNASILVNSGLGYAVTLDKLINTTGNSNLCFRPLSPKLDLEINIVWKKYQIFSKASEAFLSELQKELRFEP